MSFIGKIDIMTQHTEKMAGALPPEKQRGEAIHWQNPDARFLVTVDTEEAFDWDAPFSRTAHCTQHIPSLSDFQAICEHSGVSPVYLINQPILEDEAACDFFRNIMQNRRAFIGAHMHPWNTPPFAEELSPFNSYGCNLPRDIERAKLETVIAGIEKMTGQIPLMFRAGRYGVGENTLEILAQLGVRIDSSVRPLYDYKREGGPDFFAAMRRPYWVKRGKLAELPLTSVLTGKAASLYNQLLQESNNPFKLRSLLARLKLLDRATLSPEGFSAIEAKACIDFALKQNQPLLVFSFHSSSVEPGNNGYVRTQEDRLAFLAWWREIFAYLAQKNIRPAMLDVLAKEIFAD